MPGKKLILSFVIATALLGAVPSPAAEVTRESYKEAVEPICKTNAEANEKILDDVKANVKEGKLKAASKKFFAAARALKRTRAQLLQVPKPTADATRLTKWLGYVKTEIQLFETVARKLANGEKTRAQKMVVRLISTAKQANNLVLSFQFRYCKFPIERYI